MEDLSKHAKAALAALHREGFTKYTDLVCESWRLDRENPNGSLRAACVFCVPEFPEEERQKIRDVRMEKGLLNPIPEDEHVSWDTGLMLTGDETACITGMPSSVRSRRQYAHGYEWDKP